jgi:CheY-specific phosphatase CheX
MFNQYFGQYLLNKGYLSAAQLNSLLSQERAVRPKLGVLAIDAGLMTAAQVSRVHAMQHAMDKKFGEIALELGVLTPAQLDELLTTQQSKRLGLSQAIVDAGLLSLDVLESALNSYKKESRLTSKQLDALHKADIGSIVRAFLDFSSAGQNAEYLYDYVSLMLRMIHRFWGEEPIIACDESTPKGYMFSQKLTGPINMTTYLVMAENLLLEMAQRYSGEHFTEITALALDSIGEFLNETNGIFIVNLSEQNIELELHPQEIHQTVNLPLQNAFHIPLSTSFGTIDLYISPETGTK